MGTRSSWAAAPGSAQDGGQATYARGRLCSAGRGERAPGKGLEAPLREGSVENQSPPEGDQSAGQEPEDTESSWSAVQGHQEVRASACEHPRSCCSREILPPPPPEGAATATWASLKLLHLIKEVQEPSVPCRANLHPKRGEVNSFRQRKL